MSEAAERKTETFSVRRRLSRVCRTDQRGTRRRFIQKTRYVDMYNARIAAVNYYYKKIKGQKTLAGPSSKSYSMERFVR
jgi:hypothetical protein